MGILSTGMLFGGFSHNKSLLKESWIMIAITSVMQVFLHKKYAARCLYIAGLLLITDQIYSLLYFHYTFPILALALKVLGPSLHSGRG